MIQVYIPFTQEDVTGINPLDLDLTRFEPGAESVALAVSGNTAVSSRRNPSRLFPLFFSIQRWRRLSSCSSSAMR